MCDVCGVGGWGVTHDSTPPAPLPLLLHTTTHPVLAFPQIRVEALYEPPQEGTHDGFELLEDPRAERVAELAAALKLEKVRSALVCLCGFDGLLACVR